MGDRKRAVVGGHAGGACPRGPGARAAFAAQRPRRAQGPGSELEPAGFRTGQRLCPLPPGAGAAPGRLATLTPAQTRYLDLTAKHSTLYIYSLAALGSARESAPSPEVSAQR